MFLKSKFLGVALATYVALGISACDEASDAAKKALASVSIEQPLVTIEYNSQGTPYLSVQSQDNDTIIEDVIINRGNCETGKYKNINPFINRYHTQSSYDKLDDEKKGNFEAVYPKKLPYGEKFEVTNSCNANSIIEVELVVNGGGHLTYKFK